MTETNLVNIDCKDKERQRQRAIQDFEAAVDAAIIEMPDSFAIKKFLIANRAEVKDMFLAEFIEERVRAKEQKEQESLTEERLHN